MRQRGSYQNPPFEFDSSGEIAFPLKLFWSVRASENFAQVVKLVDTQVSGTCAARHRGSSPLLGTISKQPASRINKGFAGFCVFFKKGV